MKRCETEQHHKTQERVSQKKWAAVARSTHLISLTPFTSCNPGPACLAPPPGGLVSYLCFCFFLCGFSVCLSECSPSLLLQGVVLKADQSFATARSRGQLHCPSSPSCSSTTSPSSWPRLGPCTTSPSSTASRAAAVHSSLPQWLPLLLKAQPQLPPGSHRRPHPEPLVEVPGKLGLSQRPHGHHPWAATPPSGVLAPLGPALTLLPPLRAPLPQSRPQPQTAYPHGATPVLLPGLPPPSCHSRKIRRH